MGSAEARDAGVLGGIMLPAWERMKCPCGGEKFLQATMLRWHPTGGTTQEPGGWLCVECFKPVDMGKLVERSKLELAKEQVRALEAEIRGT